MQGQVTASEQTRASEAESGQKSLRMLHWFTWIGAILFCGYAIFLFYRELVNDADVLNCKSSEFIVQSMLLITVFIFFLMAALRT